MESLWKKTVQMPEFPRLEGEQKTDVLIIGGGLAGLLCAYELARTGVDYILVESDRICKGVTADTTAKITSQHGLLYHKLTRTFGIEKAAQYYQANEEALERYRKLCRDMDCEFEDMPSCVFSLNDAEKLEKELSALQRLGAAADYVQHPALPFATAGAVRFSHQGQFHPLKFAGGICKGLYIFEQTRVQSFDGHLWHTSSGSIEAKKTIIATHFPFLNKHGSYFLKQYQHRSYVLALKNAPKVDAMYVSDSKTGFSFRNCGERLLLGGGSHRTGKQGGGWVELEAFARKYYSDAKICHAWATQDCITLDGMPYIGRYSASTPDLYVATGFNKWGMTSSMAAAMLLRDLILGKQNPYEELFSPSRSMLRPQLAANAFHAAFDILTPTRPRCPHMGCALKWNYQEHSWDCPCHGSRFSEEGTLLDNPATENMHRRN